MHWLANSLHRKPYVTIRLQVGRPAIQLSSQEIPLPSHPRLINGATFLPVRGFASAVGLAVDYQAASHTVTVSGHLHNLSLDLGKGGATIDGQVYEGPKPFVNGGVAFAPVRLLAAVLEGQVEYVPETRTILIHRVTINLEVNLPAEVNSVFLPIRVLARKWLLVDIRGEELPWDGYMYSTKAPPEGYDPEQYEMMRLFSDLPLIPGATVVPERTLATGFDALIRGEAERAMLELCAALEKGAEWRDLAGLWFLDGGRPVGNPNVPVFENLDLLPTPHFELFELENLESYHLKTAQVMVSRGCPYRCTYCCNQAFRSVYPDPAKYVRFRSPRGAVSTSGRCSGGTGTAVTSSFWMTSSPSTVPGSALSWSCTVNTSACPLRAMPGPTC